MKIIINNVFGISLLSLTSLLFATQLHAENLKDDLKTQIRGPVGIDRYTASKTQEVKPIGKSVRAIYRMQSAIDSKLSSRVGFVDRDTKMSEFNYPQMSFSEFLDESDGSYLQNMPKKGNKKTFRPNVLTLNNGSGITTEIGSGLKANKSYKWQGTNNESEHGKDGVFQVNGEKGIVGGLDEDLTSSGAGEGQCYKLLKKQICHIVIFPRDSTHVVELVYTKAVDKNGQSNMKVDFDKYNVPNRDNLEARDFLLASSGKKIKRVEITHKPDGTPLKRKFARRSTYSKTVSPSQTLRDVFWSDQQSFTEEEVEDKFNIDVAAKNDELKKSPEFEYEGGLRINKYVKSVNPELTRERLIRMLRLPFVGIMSGSSESISTNSGTNVK